MNYERRTVAKLAVAVLSMAAMGFAAAQTKPPASAPSAAAAAALTANPMVKFATSMGDVVLELDAAAAPNTVANIVQYVKDKHYDGTIFHRVIPSFMVQGGGFDANMVEKKTRPPVKHEGQASLAKGLKNTRGTVAMARTPDPDSASAQFFINTVDNAFLDPVALPDGDPVTFNYRGQQVTAPRSQAMQAVAGYTVFGKVVAGMDVVDKIKAVATGTKGPHANVPNTPVTITKATLEK